MRVAELTLVIQGPLDQTSLSRLGAYGQIAGELVLSFWQADGNERVLGPLLGDARPGVFKSACRDPGSARHMTLDAGPHPVYRAADPTHLLVEIGGADAVTAFTEQIGPYTPGDVAGGSSAVIEFQAIYRSFTSTLAGLEEVRTPYVIKLRSDELYCLDEVVRRLEDRPGKILTNNIFVDGVRHFKISDHLMAGATGDMLAMFRRGLERAEAGDIFMDGINPRAPADPYQQRGGMNPNQLLCTSFLQVKGCEPSVRGWATDGPRHFDIVPLSLLRPYRWAFSRRYADARFVDAVVSDPAYGRSLGIEVTRSHVLVSSDATVDSPLETPAVAAGMFGDRSASNTGSAVGFGTIGALAAQVPIDALARHGVSATRTDRGVVVSPRGRADFATLSALCESERDNLTSLAQLAGAVLLRGFDVKTVADYETLTERLGLRQSATWSIWCEAAPSSDWESGDVLLAGNHSLELVSAPGLLVRYWNG